MYKRGTHCLTFVSVTCIPLADALDEGDAFHLQQFKAKEPLSFTYEAAIVFLSLNFAAIYDAPTLRS